MALNSHCHFLLSQVTSRLPEAKALSALLCNEVNVGNCLVVILKRWINKRANEAIGEQVEEKQAPNDDEAAQ